MNIFNRRFFVKINTYIDILEKQKVINKKHKTITLPLIIAFSFIVFLISTFFIYRIFKIKSTTLILSLPTFLIPSFYLKFLLIKQKNKILENFPIYIVNLKSNLNSSGDIISAIQKTKAEEPLKTYIEEFNVKIKRGINVYEAFNKLKEDIGIKRIDGFITACQMCYKNGGNFNEILKQFSSIITKENIQKEELKEKSYSSIVTLGIMFCINLYLIITFVFGNNEYSNIIRNTFGGVMILNFTAVTYIIIIYLILKIYRMEEK